MTSHCEHMEQHGICCKYNERPSFVSSVALFMLLETSEPGQTPVFLTIWYFIQSLCDPLKTHWQASSACLCANLQHEAHNSQYGRWKWMWCATNGHQLFIVETFSSIQVKCAFICRLMTWIFISKILADMFCIITQKSSCSTAARSKIFAYRANKFDFFCFFYWHNINHLINVYHLDSWPF